MGIMPFDYKNVELHEGMFKKQFDEMVTYYLNIPDDDILLGFRRRAGLPHPGNELGGWYCNESGFDVYEWDEAFNVFGQWLSAFARIYRITGDERVLVKAKVLLSEWGKTLDEDGYFFYSDNCNALHYVYEKTLGGLVDLFVYCKLEEAARYLKRITDWAEKNLDRTRLPAAAENFRYTGGNLEYRLQDNEWYTLSENLYKAYLVTGEDRYREFASVWHYDSYWDMLRSGETNKMTGLHGYSHVNNLGGAAMAYKVTGDKRYLETIECGYEIFKRNQFMASGGYAINERLADPCGSNYKTLGNILGDSTRSFEVPCGSWAGFKLAGHLISITGKALYGEWVEALLYNAIGAALPMRDDSQRRGKTFYYADYRLAGGRKVYYEASFPCCSGTYPQAVAEYYNLIYYRDSDSLYITQYIPSSVSTEFGDARLIVRQEGNYPLSDGMYIKISSSSSANFALKLRVPSWVVTDEIIVVLNGIRQDVRPEAGDWLELRRIWVDGDCVSVRFPMHLRFVPIHSLYPKRAALMYGPVMLASKGREKGMLAGDASYPDGWIKKMEAESLHFETTGTDGCRRVFVPFYEIGEREWYRVYFDLC